jgi:hypothetical protein
VVVALHLIIVGCDDGQAERSQADPKTRPVRQKIGKAESPPEATIAALWEAGDKGDVQGVQACCIPAESEWRIMQKAWCELVFSHREFFRAVRARHGEDAWAKLIDKTLDNKGGSGTLPNSYEEEVGKESWADTVEVREHGRKAVCFYVGTRVPHLRLVRRGERWYVDLSTHGRPEFFTRRVRRLTDTVNTCKDMIEDGRSLNAVASRLATDYYSFSLDR